MRSANPRMTFLLALLMAMGFYAGANLVTMTPYRNPWIVVPWYQIPGVECEGADDWLDLLFKPIHWLDRQMRPDSWRAAEEFTVP